jgi:hypothetical protein
MALPSNTQLMLPLLQTLQERGGSARPRDLYGDIADQVGVTAEERSATVNIGGRKINAFERRVRWVRQTAVMRGLISKEEDRVWRLTEAANAKLGNIQRGTIFTFAISESGAFLWANAEDAVGVIEPGIWLDMEQIDPNPDGTFTDHEDERSECQNCRLTWKDDELKEIKDLSERVAPGKPMPSGECPECGALCHPMPLELQTS